MAHRDDNDYQTRVLLTLEKALYFIDKTMCGLLFFRPMVDNHP